MYEIFDTSRTYESVEITNIARIRADQKIAASLNRHAENYVQQQVLSTGYIQHPVEE